MLLSTGFYYATYEKTAVLEQKMLCSENVVICLLAKSCKDSFIALTDKFHIRSDDVLNASVFIIY